MSQSRFVSIITAYHFAADDTQAYQRLLNSARSSLREIGDRGRLILVANGTNESAEPLENVIQAIGPARRELVVPVALERNAGNVGGLNAGIKMLIDHLGLTADSLVGLVQSSVILQPGWLNALEHTFDQEQCDVAFGRLVDECCPKKIWADGHCLKDGKTWNCNYDKNVDELKHQEPSCDGFACLSAALFRGELVESIVATYGDFVFSGIDHYGDCTDVALRAKAVANATFNFCAAAVATKRWPTLNRRAVITSQLVAATLYYRSRQNKATEPVKNKPNDSQYIVDAINAAEDIIHLKYSTRDSEPPLAATLECGNWK